MATKTCKWWRKHAWGPPFKAPPEIGYEGARCLGINLALHHPENLDAWAALTCGESIQICTVCGGARRWMGLLP